MTDFKAKMHQYSISAGAQPRPRWWSLQASKFIRQKQYYDNITKYKQYNGRLPEGNPSIELVAYSKI